MIINKISKQFPSFFKGLIQFQKITWSIQSNIIQQYQQYRYKSNIQMLHNYSSKKKKQAIKIKMINQQKDQKIQQKPRKIEIKPVQPDIKLIQDTKQYQIALSKSKQKINELIMNKIFDSQLEASINIFFQLLMKNASYKSKLIQSFWLFQLIRSNIDNKFKPIYIFVMNNWCNLLVNRGQNQKAILIFTQLCQEIKKFKLINKQFQSNQREINNQDLNTRYFDLLYNLGVLLFQSNRVQQSKIIFQELITLHSTQSNQNSSLLIDLRDNLGIIEFWQGNYDLAQTSLQKNLQITRQIIKQNQQMIQRTYLKHYFYLKTIYQLKISSTKNEQQKRQLQQKILECEKWIQLIIQAKQQQNNYNYDIFIYLQTISKSLLLRDNPQQALKYLQKSFLQAQYYFEKSKQNSHSNDIKYNLFKIQIQMIYIHKMMGDCYMKMRSLQKAIQNYHLIAQKYQKLFAMDQISIINFKHVKAFFQTAKSTIYCVQQLDKGDSRRFKYLIDFLTVYIINWHMISQKFWKLPQQFGLLPSQLNFLIGIIYIKQLKYNEGLKHFHVGINYISQNNYLLDANLKLTFSDIIKQINQQLIKISNIQVHKKQINQINQISKTLNDLI